MRRGMRGFGIVLAALVLAACAAGGGGTARPASGPAGAAAPTAGSGASTAPGGAAPGTTDAGAAPSGGSAAAPTAPPAPVALRLGLNTTNAAIAPVWVAQEQGFFTKYGIEAEPILVTGGAARVVSAVLAGETPLTIISSTAVLSAGLNGADLTFYGSYSNTLRFWLYARPEIASVQDLRGKQVAISGRGGSNQRAAELVLTRHGLEPDRDVTFISAGTMTDILTALLNGAVAGGMLSPPGTFVADDEGMRLLFDSTEYREPTIMQGIAGSRAWVAQHEDVVRRVLQALGEGVALLHKDKERSKAIIGKHSQTDDALLIERTYNAQLPGWERGLYAPPEALRAELEALAAEQPAARTARPEQFVDNRLVEELDRAGFFQQLFQ